MTRIAIPMFRRKVSPVFDTCSRVLLVDIDNQKEVDRREIYLDALSMMERLVILEKSRISVIICGGISDVMGNMLIAKKINLISDITGEIDRVVKTYLAGNLQKPQLRAGNLQKDPK